MTLSPPMRARSAWPERGGRHAHRGGPLAVHRHLELRLAGPVGGVDVDEAGLLRHGRPAVFSTAASRSSQSVLRRLNWTELGPVAAAGHGVEVLHAEGGGRG